MRDEFESCLPLCSVCVTQSIFQSVSFKFFFFEKFIFDENRKNFPSEKIFKIQYIRIELFELIFSWPMRNQDVGTI